MKIIACASMLIDHIGTVMDICLLSRYIGRIAFPIFAYLIAQGCLHTKSINRYLLRLALLAIISEPFFDVAFWYWGSGVNFVRDTNIFYTLFLGAAGIAIYEKLKQKTRPWVAALAALPMLAVAWWFNSDYSYLGVLMIFMIYAFDPQSRSGRSIALFAGLLLLYGNNPVHLAFAMVSVALVLLYNGKPGPNNAAIKWGFYFFYPAHLTALILIRGILL